MNIGANLQRARKRKNLSQEEAAIKLDVTRQCVSLWENDQTAPTLENLESLSSLYGLSISVLMGQIPFPEDRDDKNAAIEKRKEEERLRKEKKEIDDANKQGIAGMIIGIFSVLLFAAPVLGIVLSIATIALSFNAYRKVKGFKYLAFIIIGIVYLIAGCISTFSGMYLNMF